MKKSTDWSDHFSGMPNLKILHKPQGRKLSNRERESKAIQRMLKDSNREVKK